jgi:hypothetical protein
MTTTEEMELKELEIEHRRYEYMNTNTPNKCTMNCNPYINQRSNSWKIL